MDFDGILKKGSDGVQVFTNEKNVYQIVSMLLERKVRFSVQEVSLSNIFEFLVEGGEQNEEVLEPSNSINTG